MPKNTSTKNSESDSPVKYCTKNVDPVKTDQYYRIELPSDHDIELQAGDYVFQELVEENPVYIRGKKTEKEGTTTEGYYKVHYDNHIQIYTNWNEFLPDPLYQLSFEFNLEEEWDYRIYNPIDFGSSRAPELKEKGKALIQGKPLFALLASEFIDIESWKADQSQIQIAPEKPSCSFRIIPFNAKEVDIRKTSPEDIHEAVERNQSTPFQVDELSILWDPAGKKHPDKERRQTIYSEKNVIESRVNLPAKGSFQITTGINETGVWINHDDGDSFGTPDNWEITKIGNWEGKYLKNREGYISVYVPCNPEQ